LPAPYKKKQKAARSATEGRKKMEIAMQGASSGSKRLNLDLGVWHGFGNSTFNVSHNLTLGRVVWSCLVGQFSSSFEVTSVAQYREEIETWAAESRKDCFLEYLRSEQLLCHGGVWYPLSTASLWIGTRAVMGGILPSY